jgi:protein TonB
MKYGLILMAFLILAIIGCTGIDSPSESGYITSIDSIPSPDDFVAVEELPVMTYEETPRYPRKAYARGIEGTVIIQAFVDKTGTVLRAQAIRCDRPGWGFEEAAVRAAYKCRYKPAMQNGRPIGLWISYKVSFVID